MPDPHPAPGIFIFTHMPLFVAKCSQLMRRFVWRYTRPTFVA